MQALNRFARILFAYAFMWTILRPQVYAQAKVESLSKNDRVAVSNYLSALDEKALALGKNPSRETINMVIGGMSMGELKHVSRLMYDASNADAVALQDSINAQAIEFYSTSAGNKNAGIKLGFVQAKILERIRKEVSPAVYALVRVPYFLRVQVIKVDTLMNELGITSAHISIPMTQITGSIVSAYKGVARFRPGDQIQFYFLNQCVTKGYSFKVGQDYLVPLDPLTYVQFFRTRSIALPRKNTLTNKRLLIFVSTNYHHTSLKEDV
jgi:hypothetical protein